MHITFLHFFQCYVFSHGFLILSVNSVFSNMLQVTILFDVASRFEEVHVRRHRFRGPLNVSVMLWAMCDTTCVLACHYFTYNTDTLIIYKHLKTQPDPDKFEVKKLLFVPASYFLSVCLSVSVSVSFSLSLLSNSLMNEPVFVTRFYVAV